MKYWLLSIVFLSGLVAPANLWAEANQTSENYISAALGVKQTKAQLLWVSGGLKTTVKNTSGLTAPSMMIIRTVKKMLFKKCSPRETRVPVMIFISRDA